MLSRKVLMLAGSIAVVGANALTLSPIAGAVAASFPGVDAPGVMKAAAVYGLATAVGSLLWAPAIDRIGQRRGLLRALAALVAALAVSAGAPSLPVLCLGQALAGLAAGCALPAIYALSARIAEKGRESETLGIVLTGWTVSLVAGVGLSALVADLAHWRLVFAGLAVAAAWLARGVGRNRDWDLPVLPARPSSPLSALRVRGMVPALVVVAVYMTAFYGLYAYLGPHLTGVLRLPTASAGLAPAAYGLGFGLAAFMDRLLDRHGAVAAAPLAFLGLVLVYAGLAAASGQAAVLIAMCLAWGLANHVGLNLIVGRLTALNPARRGAVMGLYGTVTYLAASAGAFFYRPLSSDILSR
ncbi:MFS transporter [Fulvimonas soli]|jgi:predicted MFS family arabinose efflux permease|uniref:Putative MFS family arabinose efflux permease n=1 Tax=Fulvimonas soli TaxID=155197 RepID=A0A316IPG4_9GAMM|nr:MFS transporter [Fulvimonas soli]PWK92418.1 putative MFS family arabinose efflux permease [Fulvimonas soli]TNY24958.1 MFS transporter [Fulvimonas soli]